MTSELGNAPRIKEQASEWLARRMLGPWGETDQAALDAWLAQSLAHEIAFLRMEAGWSRTERLTVLRGSGKPLPRPAANPRPARFRVAAALAVVAVAGVYGAYVLSGSQSQTYATAVGGHKIITLSDGSRIELNTDTAIRTTFRASRRDVALLKGEAYFQVEHDAARPFVVSAAGHRVTDLGTKFLIRQNGNRLQVSLIEGKAELESVGEGVQQHSVELTPGDVAVASAEALNVFRKPEKELHDELGWRRGVIVFSHTTLAAAAAEFNRYNSTKIVIADAQIGNRMIGATLAVHDVEAFADVAHEIFGLNIQKHGNEILISR